MCLLLVLASGHVSLLLTVADLSQQASCEWTLYFCDHVFVCWHRLSCQLVPLTQSRHNADRKGAVTAGGQEASPFHVPGPVLLSQSDNAWLQDCSRFKDYTGEADPV